MRNLLPVLVLLTLLLSCSSTQQLQKEISRQISSEAFKKSFTGFMVYDPDEQKILFEQNSGKYFTPASNMKLFTFFAGLKFLEDSIPALKYSITNDSLIFWGTGDPSFLYPGLPESGVLEFLKGNEKLFYLAPSFSEKPLGPGWSWDDYNSYYSAERSAFPIYGNLVVFKNSSQEKLPKAHPAYFGSKLRMIENESAQIIRDPDSNVFRFSPDFRNRTTEQKLPFKYSEEIFVQLLKDTLEKPVELLLSKPPNLPNPRTLYSIPSDSLYKQMLQESDNFIAEQLLMVIAGKISDSLQSKTAISQTVEQHLKGIPDNVNWVDGSGLSRYNLVTPRSLVFLLEKIASEVPKQDLLSLFPAGGKNGTLKNSFLSTEPFVFAKTGSLRNNYSLSGYLLTRKGKVLIFSFMNNNFPGSSATIKTEMEEILLSIHKKY